MRATVLSALSCTRTVCNTRSRNGLNKPATAASSSFRRDARPQHVGPCGRRYGAGHTCACVDAEQRFEEPAFGWDGLVDPCEHIADVAPGVVCV
jgi:hypothetical protein